jgi:protein required for attachment to host cells
MRQRKGFWMKPVVDWILLANSRKARVVMRRGAGRGLEALKEMTWTADPPLTHVDRSGTKHSIAGHGSDTPESSDLDRLAESKFAARLAEQLEKYHALAKFDRLIIAAAPHMLGELRKHLKGPVRKTILAELDKNLTSVPIAELAAHLEDVLAP